MLSVSCDILLSTPLSMSLLFASVRYGLSAVVARILLLATGSVALRETSNSLLVIDLAGFNSCTELLRALGSFLSFVCPRACAVAFHIMVWSKFIGGTEGASIGVRGGL